MYSPLKCRGVKSRNACCAHTQQAKASHPDVLQDPEAGASFTQLLTAYQACSLSTDACSWPVPLLQRLAKPPCVPIAWRPVSPAFIVP